MENVIDERNILVDYIDDEQVTIESLKHDMTLKRTQFGRVKLVEVDIQWGMFDTFQQYMILRALKHLIRTIIDNDYKIDKIWIDDWEDHGIQYAFQFDWSDDAHHAFAEKHKTKDDIFDTIHGVWDKMSNVCADAFKEVQNDIDKFHIYVFMEPPESQKDKKSGRPRKRRERGKQVINPKKGSKKSSKK